MPKGKGYGKSGDSMHGKGSSHGKSNDGLAGGTFSAGDKGQKAKGNKRTKQVSDRYK